MVILCHIFLKNFFGIWLHCFNNVTSNSLRTNSVSLSLETDVPNTMKLFILHSDFLSVRIRKVKLCPQFALLFVREVIKCYI